MVGSLAHRHSSSTCMGSRSPQDLHADHSRSSCHVHALERRASAWLTIQSDIYLYLRRACNSLFLTLNDFHGAHPADKLPWDIGIPCKGITLLRLPTITSPVTQVTASKTMTAICRSIKELCMNLNGSSAEEQDLPRKSLDEAEAVGFGLGLKPWKRSGQGRVPAAEFHPNLTCSIRQAYDVGLIPYACAHMPRLHVEHPDLLHPALTGSGFQSFDQIRPRPRDAFIS